MAPHSDEEEVEVRLVLSSLEGQKAGVEAESAADVGFGGGCSDMSSILLYRAMIAGGEAMDFNEGRLS